MMGPVTWPRPAPRELDATVHWCRSALLSTVAVLCGCIAHATADGPLPAPPVLLCLALVGTLAAAPLLRRPASRPRVVTMLVLGQAGVHLVLTALTGHADDDPARDPSGPAWLHHLSEDLTGPHAVMALAHAAAAAAVGAWLAVGEDALWSVVWSTGRLFLPPLAPRPVVHVPHAAPLETGWRPHETGVDSPRRRRGPPARR